MNIVSVWWDDARVGTLTIDNGIRPNVEFEYDRTWVRDGWAIDPDLPLSAAPFSRSGSLFGAFSDSAPDKWGRGLLARSRPNQTLSEADYLLLVADGSRQGALRYQSEDRGWLTQTSRIPVLTDLAQLRRAAADYEAGLGEPARELVLAGVGSGGARPKAVVQDEGALWVAKFSSRHDVIEAEVAEYVVAQLAVSAGINLSHVRLFEEAEEPILLSKRFDRQGARRLGYLSAQSLLQSAVDPLRDVFDYLELADVIPELSAHATADLHELWRRIAFGCIVNNTDDHMRNHAFIRQGDGWRLSPAYDINTEVIHGFRSVSSVDGEDGEHKLESLMACSEFFRLDASSARTILGEVTEACQHVESVVRGVRPFKGSGQVVALITERMRQAADSAQTWGGAG